MSSQNPGAACRVTALAERVQALIEEANQDDDRDAYLAPRYASSLTGVCPRDITAEVRAPLSWCCFKRTSTDSSCAEQRQCKLSCWHFSG